MSRINMRQTCPGCPLQYEGEVNGTPFYYRGRWGRWNFGIGFDENSAVGVAMGQVPGFRRRGLGGDEDSAEAEEIIRRCCEEYMAEERPMP